MVNYYTKVENNDLLDLKANLTDLDNYYTKSVSDNRYYQKIALVSATRYVLS